MSGGSYYNYFRTYDPSIGRYTTSDPIGLAGGPNTYGYVGGSPLGYSDFFGLEYRYGPTDYQQFYDPNRSGCEQPIRRSGVIVGWEDCDPNKKGPSRDGVSESCPSIESSDPYTDLKDKWDGYNDAADINASKNQQAATNRLNRAVDNLERCANSFENSLVGTVLVITANGLMDTAITAGGIRNAGVKGLSRAAGVVSVAGDIAAVATFRQCVANARSAGGIRR